MKTDALKKYHLKDSDLVGLDVEYKKCVVHDPLFVRCVLIKDEYKQIQHSWKKDSRHKTYV